MHLCTPRLLTPCLRAKLYSVSTRLTPLSEKSLPCALQNPSHQMKFSLLIVFAFACDLQCFAGNDAPTSTTSKGLRILSYNIKMLPRVLKRPHHYPIKRAPLIPKYIIEENPDIVVFQEAFDGKADRILKRKLKANYPYMLGRSIKKQGLKLTAAF